jgi:hypothetical protein
MKQYYLTLTICTLALTIFGQEYNPDNSHALVESCLDFDEGSVTLTLDLTENCPEADPNGAFLGTPELGFHSGVNNWAQTIPWDAPNAATWTNDGNDVFSLTLNTLDYWGVSIGNIENIRIIGNNGIEEPNDPWSLTARDSFDVIANGNWESCSDLIIWIFKTPTCSSDPSNSKEIQQLGGFRAAPNPFSDRTFLEFENPKNQTFELNITNLHGQTVRTISGIKNTRISVEREDLPAGMYLARLMDEQGKFATMKLVVK